MAIIHKHHDDQGDEIAMVLHSYHLPPRYGTHRSVYFASAREQNYVLKPLKVGAARALLTAKLLEKRELCPMIPRLIKPESGRYYLWCNGNRYLAMEKIPGRVADYCSNADFQTAIIAMSDFHRFGRQLLQMNPGQWSVLQFNPQLQWKQCLHEMEICREIAIRFQDDAFSRQYLQMWHCFYETAFEVLQTFPSWFDRTQSTICYHDWAYHNVIIESNRAYLFDFDLMLVDHSIHDRVNLISRYLRLRRWSVAALMQALWNFDRFYHWQKGELKLLRFYLAFPYEFWMLGRQYYIEKQPWSRRYYQDQWQRKISYQHERNKILNLLKQME
jgi:hypothetical protein